VGDNDYGEGIAYSMNNLGIIDVSSAEMGVLFVRK
jgi:hypothetical protein